MRIETNYSLRPTFNVSPFNFIWFSHSSVDTEVKAISWERRMHSRAGYKILVLSERALHWSQVELVGRVLRCFRDVALREHDITRIAGFWSRQSEKTRHELCCFVLNFLTASLVHGRSGWRPAQMRKCAFFCFFFSSKFLKTQWLPVVNFSWNLGCSGCVPNCMLPLVCFNAVHFKAVLLLALIKQAYTRMLDLRLYPCTDRH